MDYINKNTGDLINQSVYSQLSEGAKQNFVQSEKVVNKTHSIVETKSDHFTTGDALVVGGVLTGLIIKNFFEDLF
jgi:hypothetical protein